MPTSPVSRASLRDNTRSTRVKCTRTENMGEHNLNIFRVFRTVHDRLFLPATY